MWLLAAPAFAQSPVALSLEPSAAGAAVPAGFSGLSFEMTAVLPGPDGRHLFRPDNHALIALFRTLGIKSLRVGGNTADNPAVPIPDNADIDSLFAFARAAGVKVIYTLRLREGDPASAAKIARYIMDHDRAELACFAVGNEPNVYEHTFPVYRAQLNRFMAAITAVAPEAKFCGPSTTPGKAAWAREFAGDFGPSGRIAFVAQHSYPGGSGRKVTDPAVGRDRMLSPAWLGGYEKFAQSFVPAAKAAGLRYRLEETNNFFNGGAQDVSDTFASALWGLDYLYWWAEHGAAGLNFHTGDHVAAADAPTACRYAVFWSAPDGYDVHPLGYALKAFNLGSHGRLTPVRITANADGLNLTAYATLASDRSLCVTLINKEHGAGARAAAVTLSLGAGYGRAQVMFLTAPRGEVAAKSGVRLGGAPIGDDAAWQGTWSALAGPSAGGRWIVGVPAATAAVVKLTAE